jgi:hypothetical protein
MRPCLVKVVRRVETDRVPSDCLCPHRIRVEGHTQGIKIHTYFYGCPAVAKASVSERGLWSFMDDMRLRKWSCIVAKVDT